jgi:hypothetical protein
LATYGSFCDLMEFHTSPVSSCEDHGCVLRNVDQCGWSDSFPDHDIFWILATHFHFTSTLTHTHLAPKHHTSPMNLTASSIGSPRDLHQTWSHHNVIGQLDRMCRTQPSHHGRPQKRRTSHPPIHHRGSSHHVPIPKHHRPPVRNSRPNLQP